MVKLDLKVLIECFSLWVDYTEKLKEAMAHPSEIKSVIIHELAKHFNIVDNGAPTPPWKREIKGSV